MIKPTGFWPRDPVPDATDDRGGGYSRATPPSPTRRTTSGFRISKLQILALLMINALIPLVYGQSAAIQCQDVEILPRDLVLSHARDGSSEFIDIHHFSKFFTYQLPTGADTKTNFVITRFDPSNGVHGAHEMANGQRDLVLRLRATLRSADMDDIAQSMKVSVVEEKSGTVIIDASSEEGDERSVHLDSLELSTSSSYLIKYEFFEKNVGLTSFEDKTISAAHMGASACSKPFVVQELVIASKDLVRQRALRYLDKGPKNERKNDEYDISTIDKHCDFSALNNTKEDLRHGENGLYCNRKSYQYSLRGESAQELNQIYKKSFTVAGAAKESVTYLFDLTLGFDFATSSQLKAVLRRIDYDEEERTFNYDPLACLYDHTCFESEQVGKNELSIFVILTPGDYQLIIFDQQENSVRRWLTDTVGLHTVPFTFDLQATPIVPNEERTMCGNKLFLSENFIQNRFISGRNGQRFSFDDQIIFALINSTQRIKIVPEADMFLKISSKEAYGVNIAMTLCSNHDCFVTSSQIGNTELLETVVRKDVPYFVYLDYSNSIITLSSFFDCPHAHLSLSMSKVDDVEARVKEQASKTSDWISQKHRESEQHLGMIFDKLSRASLSGQQFLLSDETTVFTYDANKQTAFAKSYQIVSRDFTVQGNQGRQVAFEIFYDSQFYDLEILVQSRDAGEVKTSYGKRSPDLTKYKGTKRIFAEMEPGDYTFKVVAKVPGQSRETRQWSIRYFEFQLYAACAELLPLQARTPSSLNYLGLLGPKGEGFGQLVHFQEDVNLDPRQFVDLFFTLSGASSDLGRPSIDVQVIEVDGEGEQLDISLVEMPKNQSSGKESRVHSSRYVDDWEEGVAYESLASSDLHAHSKYRVRVLNRDSAARAKAGVKIVVTEHIETDDYRSTHSHLPHDFNEVTRVKPKVPGLKESSFISGSKMVIETFKVASLQPYVPKSSDVYQAVFKTGPNTDDSFMPSLPFEVVEPTAQIYAQVQEFTGREDLFVTIYSQEDGEEVARSTLGRYSNSLGPVTLSRGKYRLVVHPDQDSQAMETSTSLIRFALDVLLEQSDIGDGNDFEVIIEEVELCSLPSLPDNFNGPGFLHPLSGNGLQTMGRYRLTEVLENAEVKFQLNEVSHVNFYFELPEGLKGEAELVRETGTYQTKVSTDDLNKGDESFLKKEGGFQHRAVIQIREFLDPGSYTIRLRAWEATGTGVKVQPRCEGYTLGLHIMPIFEEHTRAKIGDECFSTKYTPEHLAFDEVKQGHLIYPSSANTIDVAYLDLKANGGGPFIFFFEVAYDPSDVGVMGISLAKYDADSSSFRQAALYRSPQEGVTQLFAVVETGTYAIGIQTLTSTKHMFNTGGLGSKARHTFGDRLLHQSCTKVHYNYLITSTVKGDLRAMQATPLGMLGLMLGGGLAKIAKQRQMDSMLLDELGDSRNFGSCLHDDLPYVLPITESGFDESYDLLVQEKPSDILELVVLRESLVRISIRSSNFKNQVRAFIYPANAGKKTPPMAWTEGGRQSQTLLHLLPPHEKAYKIRLEYESIDQDDPCPSFQFRLIQKPIAEALREDLHCEGGGLPPATLNINTDDFIHSEAYSFPSDYVTKVTNGGRGSLEYDIVLKWPNADPKAEYYVDVETRSDFLANQMSFSLLYEDKNRVLRPLGRSMTVKSSLGKGELIQRLKLLEREGDMADDINLSGAILRLKLPGSVTSLPSILKQSLKGDEVCNNFRLSVRAEKVAGGKQEMEQSPPRLMRVRWEGRKTSQGLFDPRSKLVASLEFDRSMSGAFQVLKSLDWAWLTPDTKGGEQAPNRALPSYKTLSPGDSSTVVLQFAPGAIVRGWCYKLALSPFPNPAGGAPAFDEGLLSRELKVCSSNCHCAWEGTSSCSEPTGQCTCKFPHTGPDCGQCEHGHAKDPITGECRPSSRCKENGGKEDCNGHGTCEQRGEVAACSCTSGFANDGLDQCAKCSDPLFSYPDCQVRNWVLEEPDINCRDLEYRMPRTLYLGEGGVGHSEPFQGEDGVLNWAKRYRLSESNVLRKSSTHWFLVPSNSVMRFFVDTVQSGVLVKYRVMDADYNEILSSRAHASDADEDGYVESGSDLVLLHQPVSKEAGDAPFTLLLEYKEDNDDPDYRSENECPVVDLRVVVEPLITAESAVKCSDLEMHQASQSRAKGWTFGSQTRFEQEKVVLRSDDTQLFQHANHEESVNFAIVSYDLSVQASGNALSIVATYPFSSMVVAMTLYEVKTGEAVELEKTSSLDGIEHAPTAITRQNDMATYIEASTLEAGNYRLDISIARAYFLPTEQYPTCLGFDLVVEYVTRSQSASSDQYQVLSVFPLSLQEMKPTDEKVIDVEFDQPIVLDDMLSRPQDRLFVCSLINTRDIKKVVHPRHVEIQGTHSFRLDFDFRKEKHLDGQCFKVQCSTAEIKKVELIAPMQVTTSYCFQTQEHLSHDSLQKCNPFAVPKVTADGTCVCSSPYTGSDCESCEEGFIPIQRDAESSSHKNATGTHTHCTMDHHHLSQAVCNSHGRPVHSEAKTIDEIQCHCDPGFGGTYCDYCVDPSFAYPDCHEAISSLIYDPEATHEFLSRRKYNEHGYSTVASQYFGADSLEPTIFNEECAWVDYPDDLDRVELTKEFKDGSFHLADLYVVNHKQDNVLKFTPQQTGVLKVLVQQPEVEEELAGESGAAFDLEIGIYEPRAKKFLKSEMNRHLVLSGGRPAKLEYTSLAFEVGHDHLDSPLYVFFRALNYTDNDEAHRATEGCLALFIEAEFSPAGSECLHNPAFTSSSNLQVLKDESHLAAGSAQLPKGTDYSVKDPSSTFLAYRDYYVEERSQGTPDERLADMEVTVSLMQKFVESNTLDLVVEILQEDVDFNTAQKPISASHQPGAGLIHHAHEDGRVELVRGGKGPTCSTNCFVGGEKSFNEMMRVISISPRTSFRVWIFQQSPDHRDAQANWCANFQLSVTARPLGGEAVDQMKKQADLLKCPVPELPETLNSPHYLQGPDSKQKDFHYSQRYRIDHLWHNRAHQIGFKLEEPTVFRVVAPIHRHLDFELVLNQEKGAYDHKTLIRAKKEDYHSTIFAQLEPGEYHLKLAFATDSALLQLPCQTVQLEMAMMTVARAKDRQAALKEAGSHNSTEHLTLGELMLQSAHTPMKMYRQAAVGWRHIEPGVPPYIDQAELYKELFREGFEIAEDDEAGLVVDVHSDFLLSGVNFALSNVATGQVIEEDGSETSGKLVVGRLLPGEYELIVYTHECITNMDPAHGEAIASFDTLVHMSVRLIRLTDQHLTYGSAPKVQVEILDYESGSPQLKAHEDASPLQVTKRELACLREYRPLPETLDIPGEIGPVDMSDHFFVPTASFHTHHIRFTAKPGQDALQVLLAKSNSKVAVYEVETRTLVAQSKPLDQAKAQLLIARSLKHDTAYAILLEFSESTVGLDGEAAEDCEHFVLSAKTWDNDAVCQEVSKAHTEPITIDPSSEPMALTFVELSKKSHERELTIHGHNPVDIEISVDSSSSFYRAELTLKKAQDYEASDDSEEASVADLKKKISPTTIDFSVQGTTIYSFSHLEPGAYKIKLRERFKASQCASPAALSVKSWTSASRTASLNAGGLAGLNLYQSQQEDQERPRLANRLPLDLDSLKFKGASSKHVLFSGPIQLDQIENQNFIHFSIDVNDTIVHFYGEHSGLALSIWTTDAQHPKSLGAASGGSLTKKLAKGSYRVKMSLASAHERKAALAAAPRVWLTISVSTPENYHQYNSTWFENNEYCEEDSSFPLALRQQKQADVHQLFYSYPLIKVSPSALREKTVLQTYNFRVNVTSRLYFEVGMHLLNSHVSLQMSALNDKGFTVQGKQRGNLNVLDTQIGPGDYSVAVKQVMSSFDRQRAGLSGCAVFSLQGLVDPISLMSATANSGEILQRGLSNCPAAADGDVLPAKIYGSESQTRGGGELHVDSTGHFMRRFRNVLMKMSREFSETAPEFDRVELEVVEDSWLHLSFLYEAFGPTEIKVQLTDTMMLGREVTASASYEVMDIDNNRVELITEYQLAKGRHYALTVTYTGAVELDEEGRAVCAVYDLTMSVSHAKEIVAATRCPAGDAPSFVGGLPHTISDHDLDDNGEFLFDKLLRLHYPNDFKSLQKQEKGAYSTGSGFGSLDELVFVKLSHNYDINVAVEFEFDQGLFTVSLDELVNDEDGELTAVQSHLQAPLAFKQNNDHYRTMKRELVADDVESHGQSSEHALLISNRQPDFLHVIHPGPHSEGCLFINVKIHIRSTDRSTPGLYQHPKESRSVVPLITACRPDDSPAFLHGRPEQVSFAVLFNKRPYLNGQGSSESDLRDAFRVKVTTVNMQDGVRSEQHLAPVQAYSSTKEYREDEYHLTVEFDVSEFVRSATEKISHAQLVGLERRLVDSEGSQFGVEQHLRDRGLPIYVFEQADLEQLLKEETSEIRGAVQGEVQEMEAERQQNEDVSTELSDLEAKVKTLQAQLDQVPEEPIKCLCVHGQCAEGETQCSGGCSKGWTGPHCDTPSSSESAAPVNQNKKKDFTNDGLYRPQTISDVRVTGPISSEASTEPQRREEVHGSKKPKKIIEDTPHTSKIEQMGSPQELVSTTSSPSTPESHEETGLTTGQIVGLIAIFLGVYYCSQNGLCTRANQAPQRYRPLQSDGGLQDESDDDEEEDDTSARRRMMELSNLGGQRNQGPNSQQQEPERQNFPATQFRQQQQNQPGPQHQQPQQAEDDPAEELQRELELFAQDEDESNNLLGGDEPQNQEDWGEFRSGGSGAPRDGQAQDEAELQEYERYFDEDR